MVEGKSENWPQSVAEAVDRLITDLDDESKAMVRHTPRQQLIQFHHGWGTGIRNSFGLWQGNQALLQSCGCTFPDDASMVIIEAVWERLQND